jgi:transposase
MNLRKEFKAKVVFEALKEKDTIVVFAEKTGVAAQPNFNVEAIRNLFTEKTVVAKNEILTAQFYARLGQLTLDNDFKKKVWFSVHQ